jgi:hypothetical protein
MDIYITSLLKQQSTGRLVAPIGYIIPTPSRPVFAIFPSRCVVGGKATKANIIVFG